MRRRGNFSCSKGSDKVISTPLGAARYVFSRVWGLVSVEIK